MSINFTRAVIGIGLLAIASGAHQRTISAARHDRDRAWTGGHAWARGQRRVAAAIAEEWRLSDRADRQMASGRHRHWRSEERRSTRAWVRPFLPPDGQSRRLLASQSRARVRGSLGRRDEGFWRSAPNSNRTQQAVRQGDWKLVVDANHLLLYNLREDVGERHDHTMQRLTLSVVFEHWSMTGLRGRRYEGCEVEAEVECGASFN